MVKRKVANESLSRLRNNQILNAKDTFLYCNKNILKIKFLDQVPFFSTWGNLWTCSSRSVVLKLFAPAAHFATFPNFAAHLDQSADLFWSVQSFLVFPLPDAL